MAFQGHSSQNEFFTRLTALFETRKAQSHGSIYLIQKRLNHPLDSSVSQPINPDARNPVDGGIDFDPFEPPAVIPTLVLIRATNGVGKSRDAKSGRVKKDKEGKLKLSTVVPPEELEGFFVRYAEVCRNGMAALKKRDRKAGRKKGKKTMEGSGK